MSNPNRGNAILVIGGAADKVYEREILSTFLLRSGGTNAKIGIVPTASPEPILTGERYESIFKALGARSIGIFDIRDGFSSRGYGNADQFGNRAHAENIAYLSFLEDCTGVFLTGGEPRRLSQLFADTPIIERLRQRVHAGEITLGGTGAGAAVMGYKIIIGGGSGVSPRHGLVERGTGLGIIPEVIIEPQFNGHNSMARLISAIAIHPDRTGIGIDEDTCVIFERDNRLRVIGQGSVTIIDPKNISYNNQSEVGIGDPLSIHNLRVHILTDGDCYQLKQNQPMRF